jgi:hypothetical protein
MFCIYNPVICCTPTISMDRLEKLRLKKEETVEKVKEQTTPQPSHPTNAEPPPGRRIKSIRPKENLSTNKSSVLPWLFFLTDGHGGRLSP